MKRFAFAILALVLLASAALALTLIVSVTAAPYSEAGGSGTADGPSNLYITIVPSAEIAKPTTTITVYESGQVIWTGVAIAVNEKKIKTYADDAFRKYTVEIQETDGLTVRADLLHD